MTKIKKALALLLAVIIIGFLAVVPVVAVYADAPATETEFVNPNISNDESTFVMQFTDYLKAKYGTDYEFYYNQIIERWGSVEAYLLSLGEGLPEEYKTGWDKFVGWLGEYSVIWAPALALLIVIIVAVIGKKYFEKIIEKIVNKLIKPIVKELNSQSRAQVATMRAQRGLMGNNEKFAETVKELEESERGLSGEQV